MSCDRKFPQFAAHVSGTSTAIAALFGGDAEHELVKLLDTARGAAKRASVPEQPPEGAPLATQTAYLEWRAKERKAKVLCAALFKRMKALKLRLPAHSDAVEFDGVSLPGKRDAIHGYAEVEQLLRSVAQGTDLPPMALDVRRAASEAAWERVRDELTPVMEGTLDWSRQQDALAEAVGVARRILNADERPACVSEDAYDRLVQAAEELNECQRRWVEGDTTVHRRDAAYAAVTFAARYQAALGVRPFNEDTVQAEGAELAGQSLCAWAIANDDQIQDLAPRKGLYATEIPFDRGLVETFQELESERAYINVTLPGAVAEALDAFWREREEQQEAAERLAEQDFAFDLENGYWKPDTPDPDYDPPTEDDVDLDRDNYDDDDAYETAVKEAVGNLADERRERREQEIEAEREKRKQEAHDSPAPYDSAAAMDVIVALRDAVGGEAARLPKRPRFLDILGKPDPAAEALRSYPAIRDLAASERPYMPRPETGVLHPLEDLAYQTTLAADPTLARIGRRIGGMRNFRATRGAAYDTDLRDFARAVVARAEGNTVDLAGWDARAAQVALVVQDSDLAQVARECFHPDYAANKRLETAVRMQDAADLRSVLTLIANGTKVV